MNIFASTLTKKKAELLLQRCGDGVPIKISSIQHPSQGYNSHWMKGTMYGLRGGKVLFRPLNNHGQDEYAPIESCRLWKSRMDEAMIEQVLQVERALSMLEERRGDTTAEKKIQPVVQMSEVAINLEKSDMSVNNHNSVSDTLQQQIIESESSLSFRQKIEQQRKLRDEIQAEGHKQLLKLQEDRKQAMDMVKTIDSEIEELQMLLGIQNPTVQRKTKKVKLTTEHSTEQKNILLILSYEPERWFTSTQVRDAINFGVDKSNFSHVYNPLVEQGLVAKKGTLGGTCLRFIPISG